MVSSAGKKGERDKERGEGGDVAGITEDAASSDGSSVNDKAARAVGGATL